MRDLIRGWRGPLTSGTDWRFCPRLRETRYGNDRMMDPMHKVSVVIPTGGAASRTGALDRAIESVLLQTGAEAQPIVVLNGESYSPEGLGGLERRTDIRLIQVPQPSVSNARLVGRKAVETPFFTMLDDDDEILPNGLATCLARFDRAPELDVVAGNGFLDYGDRREIAFEGYDRHQDDHAQALMHEQWLSSGGALFKTDTVTVEYLEDLPDILEWTVLALRLSLDRRIERIGTPVFLKHEGHTDQVTASRRYREQCPEVFRLMIDMPVPPHISRELRRKRVDALHYAASVEMNSGSPARAWRHHLQSLTSIYGLKYVLFTRHLLLGLL